MSGRIYIWLQDKSSGSSILDSPLRHSKSSATESNPTPLAAVDLIADQKLENSLILSYLPSTDLTKMSKVHPMNANIALRYDVASVLSEATRLTGYNNRQKKLRRLPHIFAKVLELPFRSSADVSVYESPNSFRFAVVADADEIGSSVRTEVVEICPGVVKIVVRVGSGGGGGGEDDESAVDLGMDEFGIDLWRFRLPDCTRPDMASAVCVDGELVVVVPKGVDDAYSDVGRLVIVQ